MWFRDAFLIGSQTLFDQFGIKSWKMTKIVILGFSFDRKSNVFWSIWNQKLKNDENCDFRSQFWLDVKRFLINLESKVEKWRKLWFWVSFLIGRQTFFDQFGIKSWKIMKIVILGFIFDRTSNAFWSIWEQKLKNNENCDFGFHFWSDVKRVLINLGKKLQKIHKMMIWRCVWRAICNTWALCC